MPRKSKSNTAFVKDLKEALEKHNHSGKKLRVSRRASAAATVAAATAEVKCPPGTTRKVIVVKNEDGSSETMTVCIEDD